MVACAVIFSIIIYKAALKKTIDEYASCSELENKLQTANNAPAKMAELEKMNRRLDMLLGRQTGNIDAQQSLLDSVTNYCQKNDVVLQEFPKPIISSNKGTDIETNIFTIEGGFNKLIQLIYLFEQKYKTGKIVSVDYRTKKDFSVGKTNLSVTIYLQNIKKSQHEI
jgi:hypothetical protein